jgi:two-component system, NarL family, nitrate/nitrite response regulator NarL
MMSNKSAVVVEDYKLIAQAWGSLLQKTGRFSDVHILNDSEDINSKIENFDPELILMDINLPGDKNGIEISQDLIKQNPELKIIILSMHNEPMFVRQAMEAGAKGYVTKSSPIKELRLAVETVLAGNTYICDEIMNCCK